jgi:hypothetical protein
MRLAADRNAANTETKLRHVLFNATPIDPVEIYSPPAFWMKAA